MKRTVQLSTLSGLFILSGLLGFVGGCDDDDCGWRWRCYLVNGVSRCYWVWTCKSSEPEEKPDAMLGMQTAAFDAGDGRFDVRVEVTGDFVEPETPVSVVPRGFRVPEMLRQSDQKVWWFSGLSSTAVTRFDVELVGTDVARRGELPPGPFPPGSGCDALAQVDTDLFPEIPATLAVGGELSFFSPPGEDLLVQGENRGVFVALFPPRGGNAQTFALPEGEGATIPLRQRGVWNIQVFLFSNDLCEPGSTNLVVVQEADVLVQ